jgi:hypothetical protein
VPASRDHVSQQPEFTGRKAHLRSRYGQLVRRQIQLEFSELVHFHLFCLASAQEGIDACDQFPYPKRFANVIVRSELGGPLSKQIESFE